MKERPILMQGDMVRATLAGLKTETRRVINHLLGFGQITEFGKSDTPGYDWHFRDKRGRWNDISHDRLMECCPWNVDQLWVRETWCKIREGTIFYKADDEEQLNVFRYLPYKWKPSIHMFRKDSRIQLLVKEVKVERVQDITAESARAEGVGHGFQMNAGWPDYRHITEGGICKLTQDTADMSFSTLWDKINKHRGYGWESNCYVWPIKFEMIK